MREESDHSPANGKPIKVTVFAEPGKGDDPKWSIDWNIDNGPPKGNTDIEVPARKSTDPSTPISFHLNDSTGRGLRFDEDDPIWVKRSDCPEGSSQDPEIPADGINPAPNLLKVVDRNAEECVLHYNLRFRDRDGKAVGCDPRIRNGGMI